MPRWVWVCLFFAVIAGLAKPAVRADLAKHNPSSQFRAAESNDRLIVDWSGERGLPLRIAFDLADSERLIAELSIAGRIILKDAAPAYWVYVGQRHGSWEDNYFDNPSSRPHEISSYSGKLLMKECRIEDRGERLLVTFTGFSMGVFQGDIVFTLYAGSNLVKQEAVVATQEPSVAYYYDASLTH